MRLRRSHRFAGHGFFYGCSRFPACRGTHGAHADGKPLGIPANRETKAARILAHAAFDQLWKGKEASMKRGQAYAWMRKALGFEHIGELTKDECAALRACLFKEFGIEAKDGA